MHVLKTTLWLPRPVEEVFPFFANAENLGKITPASLNWQIITPLPINMKEGALIEYRIRVRGLPIKWKTKISEWDPPFRFVDEQMKGPYRVWHHTHEFEPERGGTMCRDVVRYDAPGGPLIHATLVKPDLEKIFRFRQEAMARMFGDGKAEVGGVEIGRG